MKKLTKSHNKKVAGVLGGIADYYDLDPTVVRVFFVLVFVFSCGIPAILFYILAAAIMPSADSVNTSGNYQDQHNHNPGTNNSHSHNEPYNHNGHQSNIHDAHTNEEPRNPHE